MTGSEKDSPAARARKICKVTRACDACKAKKKACTGTIPCAPCAHRQLPCTYDTAYNRGVATSPPPSSSRTRDRLTPDVQPQSSPTFVWSAISDRAQSPRIALASLPRRAPQSAFINASEERGPAELPDQYWGPSSAHSFLGQVVQELRATPSKSITLSRDPDAPSTVSIFSYGDRILPEVQLTDFAWPDETKAQSLIRRYFEFAAPTYRVLHQPTVQTLLHRLYPDAPQGDQSEIGDKLDVASQAVVLLLLSTASMFRADRLLSLEMGAPSLASVQARFLMVLYLLSSSRAQKAWFTFGTAVQLMMALGLHSRRARMHHGKDEDVVQKECRRRLVWCSYTLDKYLSVILGRPRLWKDEDLTEDLPTRINDEDLTSGETRLSKRDCMMDAPILTQAAKEPYVLTGLSNRQQIKTIGNLCRKVADWQAELPPFLSGVIQPSSLVPVFRRQLTVLQLARHHALIFITRPLLLRDYGHIYEHHLRLCLTAASDAIELIMGFVRDDELFPAFWYSQYIAFNALSAIYIYLIQVMRGRLPPVSIDFNASPDRVLHIDLVESTLYGRSEDALRHLADATARNAPSWKYSVILQSLRREARLGLLTLTTYGTVAEATDPHHRPCEPTHRSVAQAREPSVRDQRLGEVPARDYVSDSNEVPITPTGMDPSVDPGLLDPRTQSLLDNFVSGEDPILDFWPQLDSLPIILKYYDHDL
ncbi:C6 transcription factor [Aspergillus sclerotioniger CBS 115572]|uniref:C6 transcription factor n=1 Tax=Aspergillus sclerotioniger CBS 115572 TaxID=1450535 RepID=A0A317WQV0_9EURO|nr:C6 transcription factor [Aspergillus sclerotioniger CBS 115572]PWY88884.1 C6 transcription factor [Aspergillus sclerotioniger CBS 115572]